MKREIIRFYDPESEQRMALDVQKTVTTADGQIWKIGSTRNAIDWAVPVGFPNASNPICVESDPEAYYELANLKN